MEEIKKKLKEISQELKSIKWDFEIANDYLSETEDISERVWRKGL